MVSGLACLAGTHVGVRLDDPGAQGGGKVQHARVRWRDQSLFSPSFSPLLSSLCSLPSSLLSALFPPLFLPAILTGAGAILSPILSSRSRSLLLLPLLTLPCLPLASLARVPGGRHRGHVFEPGRAVPDAAAAATARTVPGLHAAGAAAGDAGHDAATAAAITAAGPSTAASSTAVCVLPLFLWSLVLSLMLFLPPPPPLLGRCAEATAACWGQGPWAHTRVLFTPCTSQRRVASGAGVRALVARE